MKHNDISNITVPKIMIRVENIIIKKDLKKGIFKPYYFDTFNMSLFYRSINKMKYAVALVCLTSSFDKYPQAIKEHLDCLPAPLILLKKDVQIESLMLSGEFIYYVDEDPKRLSGFCRQVSSSIIDLATLTNLVGGKK